MMSDWNSDDDRERIEATQPFQLREMNRPSSFLSKLGRTVLLLVIGALVTPLIVPGYAAVQAEGPMWAWAGRIALNAGVVFYVTLLIYTWWQPAWLRSIYQNAERKLVLVGHGLNICVLLALLAGAVYGVVTFLKGP